MSTVQRLSSWVRRHPVGSAVGVAAAAGVAAYLVFGVFGFHLLFVDETVEEAGPFEAGPGASGLEDDAVSEDTATAMNEAMAEDDMPMEDAADEPMPTMADGAPRTLLSGEFIDRSHPTSGRAKVVTDGTRRVLRLEDLQTDNGPDLNVYLVAAAPDAGIDELDADVVDLGDLKGNVGDQNYDIPGEVDLDRYTTAVIWCVRFRVAFGAAGLE